MRPSRGYDGKVLLIINFCILYMCYVTLHIIFNVQSGHHTSACVSLPEGAHVVGDTIDGELGAIGKQNNARPCREISN